MPKPQGFDAIIPDAETVGQYCESDCLELAGCSFYLLMDDGEDCIVTFVSGDTLSWGTLGGATRLAAYRCLKLADDIYFLFPGCKGAQTERRLYAALDLQASQITVIDADADCTPRFGMVVTAGEPVFDARPAVSKDLEGTCILWRLSPRFALVHRYGAEGSLYAAPAAPWERITDTEGEAASDAYVMKLREDVYLIAAFYPAGVHLPEMQLMLADLNSIRCVGCCLLGSADGSASVHVAISGYGAFLPPAAAQNTQKEAAR